MKRLLVLSHAAVLDVNRAPFQALARVSEAEVRMIVPRSWQGDLIRGLRFEKSENDRNIDVVPLPIRMSGNGSLFFYGDSLGRQLRGWQPDQVFVDEEPWSLSALQSFRAFRDYPRCFFTKQNLRKRLPLPFRVAEKWVFRESTHAYSVAEEVTDVLRWKGYSKDIRYLPHSFDPEIFCPLSSAERSAQRRALGLPEDALVIGYLGRMTEEKGIDDLMQALNRGLGNSALRDAWAVFIGNGPLYERVSSWCSTQPRAVAHPAIPHDQVGKALGAIDILVLPSRTTPRWKEQFGRVIIEAMAIGAAVAGSDSGEIPNLIRRTGGGAVFRERDPESLAATLLDLVSSPSALEEKRRQGLSHVQSHFSHDAVARYLAGDLGIPLRS